MRTEYLAWNGTIMLGYRAFWFLLRKPVGRCDTTDFCRVFWTWFILIAATLSVTLFGWFHGQDFVHATFVTFTEFCQITLVNIDAFFGWDEWSNTMDWPFTAGDKRAGIFVGAIVGAVASLIALALPVVLIEGRLHNLAGQHGLLTFYWLAMVTLPTAVWLHQFGSPEVLTIQTNVTAFTPTLWQLFLAIVFVGTVATWIFFQFLLNPTISTIQLILRLIFTAKYWIETAIKFIAYYTVGWWLQMTVYWLVIWPIGSLIKAYRESATQLATVEDRETTVTLTEAEDKPVGFFSFIATGFVSMKERYCPRYEFV